MHYRNEYVAARRPPSRGRCALVALVVLVWIALLALLAVRFIARPLITNALERRLAQQVGSFTLPLIPAGGSTGEIPPGPQVIPLTESDANQWVRDNRDQFQGIDSVVLHFLPGQITADVTVGGFTSTASAGAAVQDGRVVVVNPQLGPPLNMAIDVAPFTDLLQERLNADIASLNRRATALSIEQGQITVTLE